MVALGSLGAWLLFAGPIYQAALELGERRFVRAGFETTARTVPRPSPVSPWWWLLPPVAYIMHRRRDGDYQSRVMAALTPDQRVEVIGFMNKATGWFIVGTGASMFALKETWELTELLGWGFAAFVALAIAAGLLSLLYTVVRMKMTARMLESESAAE